MSGEKYPSTDVKYDEHMNVHAPLSCDKDDPSPECQGAWNDFWEEHYYPEEYYPHPDQKQYTEEEMNAMCEQAASEAEKQKCREYNLREAEYYDKRAKLDASYNDMIAKGYTMTDDGFWIQPMKKELTEPQRKEYLNAKINAESHWNDGWTKKYYQEIVDKYEGKKDKVVKWQLPVEVDGASGEYFVSFPDDLLEATDLKEGDQVEWIDQGNGSFVLKKTFQHLRMDEC